MKKTTLVILATIGDFITIPWGAFVLSILWNWFFVPFLHLPTISLLVALGFSLVLSMFVHSSRVSGFIGRQSKDWSAELAWYQIADALIYPLIMLGIGALVHVFI